MLDSPSLRYVTGDATDPDTSDGRPAVITHICNDIGLWGAGFVVALSNRWPEPEEAYRRWAENSMRRNPPERSPFALGRVQFVPVGDGITIANMIGQHGVGHSDDGPPIRYPALTLCLRAVREYAVHQNAHVHMPRIGAGLAGGDWDIIEGLIVGQLLTAGNIPVTVYDLPATDSGDRVR